MPQVDAPLSLSSALQLARAKEEKGSAFIEFVVESTGESEYANVEAASVVLGQAAGDTYMNVDEAKKVRMYYCIRHTCETFMIL